MSYQAYKPLRNKLRTLARDPSLYALHAHINHLQRWAKLPADVEFPQRYVGAPVHQRPFHGWQLELLAKEVLVNCPARASKDLRRWGEMADAINILGSVEDRLYSELGERRVPAVLMEMYRIAHRQFPWQGTWDPASITRYFKIFSAPAVEQIIRRVYGVSTRQLYAAALAALGHYVGKVATPIPVTCSVPGLPETDARSVLARWSADDAIICDAIQKSQSYDADFAYTLNPLRFTPLIEMEFLGSRQLVAPVPDLLLRRATDGVFFDIVGQPDFGEAFGASFEAYVGQVLALAGLGRWNVLPEHRYYVGAQEKRSVDWIVSDHFGHLFVECKTKRIRHAAKQGLTDTSSLESDLEILAKAIEQTYRGLDEAIAGRYPHFRMDDRPVFPVVVTLDDWYPFGGAVLDKLHALVEQRLDAVRVSRDLLTDFPYTVCSIAALEDSAQVMAAVGIANVMRTKTEGDASRMLLEVHVRHAFNAEYRAVNRNLFPDVFERLGDLTSL